MDLPTIGAAISFSEAARSPHLYKPVDPSTIHRWASRGLSNGCRLKSWRIAGRRVTTEAALAEFLAAGNLAANNLPNSQPLAAPSIDSLANQQAKDELQRRGFRIADDNWPSP